MNYPTSVFTLSYTYAHSAYSCISFVFPIHLGFAYMMDLFGILCFITRVWDKYKKWHWICGRIYLMSLLWCIGSSLLIHNHGANIVILIAMLCMILSTSIGYLAISVHKYKNPASNINRSAWERFFH
jgi:multisubunit Na+/H+ antiporter MnhG subunit